MKRFVVKNRQKRKYVKKSEKQSLYSFSKTTYGMLPVLIMIIVFMATLVISPQLRESFFAIRFTFQFPQYSISNPFLFFQNLEENITQLFATSTFVASTFLTSLSISLIDLFKAINKTKIHYNYQPIHIFNIRELFILLTFTTEGLSAIFQSVIQIFLVFIHFIQLSLLTISIINTSFNTFVLQIIISASGFVVTGIETLTHAILETLLIIWQTAVQTGIVLFHVIETISLFVSQILLLILTTIYTYITIAVNTMLLAVTKAVDEVIFAIEIPFKTLAHFFLLLKPYLIILENHIQMVGKDFTNSAASFGKLTAYMSSSK